MKSKHTPGPWVTNHKFARPVVGYDPKDGGDLLPIAKTVGGFDLAQTEANARLIAASPELLAACREALIWIDQDSRGEEDCVKQIEAAIAKAEGRDA